MEKILYLHRYFMDDDLFHEELISNIDDDLKEIYESKNLNFKAGYKKVLKYFESIPKNCLIPAKNQDKLGWTVERVNKFTGEQDVLEYGIDYETSHNYLKIHNIPKEDLKNYRFYATPTASFDKDKVKKFY